MQVKYSDGWFYVPSSQDSAFLKNKKKWIFTGKTYRTKSFKEVSVYKDSLSKKASKVLSKVSIHPTHLKPEDIAWYKRLVLYSKLDPVQKLGVDFSLSRNHSYLAFEAGVGKTATAIVGDTILRILKGGVSLYVVPANLISNWLSEISEWTPTQRVKTIKTIYDVPFNVDDYDIILCADSLFLEDQFLKEKIVAQFLKSHIYTNIVVDEAHRFINEDSKRTQELMGDSSLIVNGIVHKGSHVVLLSGTHMKRGPIDLYVPVRSLAWNLISFITRATYGIMYCGGHKKRIGSKEVWDFTSSSNEDDLKKRVYKRFIFEKDLVVKGEKIERIIKFDTDKIKEVLKIEDALFKKKRLEDLIGTDKVSEIPKYRKLIAKTKVNATYEYILDQSQGKPFVIFCVYHDTIDLVLKKFKKLGIKEISGRVSKKERLKIEDEFNRGKIKAVVWQVQTAYGVNFQKKCNRCFFIESSWADDENHQAINRFYRRGQEKNVFADHLVLANSLDESVLRVSINKHKTKNKVKGS